MQPVNRWSLIIPVIIISLYLVSCSGNHSTAKTISRTSTYHRIIERADKDKRYFIMYSGVDTYRVTSVEVERTKQQFTVHLAKVDSVHVAHLKNPGAITDKHIQMYMRDSASYTLDEPHTILVAKVARIELLH